MPVNQVREDYAAIKPKWQRLRDCAGGRDAVIKAGATYCPDLPGGEAAENRAYRERGNFYNAVGRTVQGLNGMIFQEAPEVTMQESLKSILLDDITLTNVPFETFAQQVGKEVFLTGRQGVLVDMPQALSADSPVIAGSVAASPAEMRAYCVPYCAEEIINWRTQRRGSDEILTMVVLSEKAEVGYKPDDPFTCVVEEQYRVIMLDAAGKCITQIWRKNAVGDKWEKTIEGDVPLKRRGEQLTFIPFVFLGALQAGPDLEHPPLIDLADINLGHWRNSVDYEYGLHHVALPTPWVSGSRSSDSGPMKIGPTVVWELDTQGSAGMLEFSGEGLKSIVAAMDEKKKQMASLGARLLEDMPAVPETATAARMRHTGESASLKTVAQSLEMGLTQVLQICVWWQGTDATPTDADVSVELNKEYLDVRATPQEIQAALTALQAGEISFETWYDLLQSGGWAREGVDVETEQRDIAKRKVDVSAPAIDPNLSPSDVVPPPAPTKKVITRTATGYEVTQQ
jgi:hypothetical protein